MGQLDFVKNITYMCMVHGCHYLVVVKLWQEGSYRYWASHIDLQMECPCMAWSKEKENQDDTCTSKSMIIYCCNGVIILQLLSDHRVPTELD